MVNFLFRSNTLTYFDASVANYKTQFIFRVIDVSDNFNSFWNIDVQELPQMWEKKVLEVGYFQNTHSGSQKTSDTAWKVFNMKLKFNSNRCTRPNF